ncbi:MAG: acyltransferase [Acidobacteriaceae bacterium]
MEAAQELASRTAGPRYLELDSLRGVAALVVVIYHCSMAYSLRVPWYLSPLVSGNAAVLLFFVLSGFVLSLPFWGKGHNGSYGAYVTRRFFRIYVPYVAAVALAAAGAMLFPHSRLELSDWFRNTWQSDVTPRLLARHLVMSGGQELNMAFWSLRYELQMSIVFPLLLLVLRAMRPALAVVVFIALFAIADNRLQAGVADHWHYLDTLKYGSLFALGAVLGRTIHWLHGRWHSLSRVTRFAVFATGLSLYFGVVDALFDRAAIDLPDRLLVSLGACVVLVCCMCSRRLRTVLRHRVPAYLGRISYSMYLVHGTMLFALLNLLFWKVSAAVFAVIYLVATLAASHLFCIAVEEPSLRAGKALAGRWKGRSV